MIAAPSQANDARDGQRGGKKRQQRAYVLALMLAPGAKSCIEWPVQSLENMMTRTGQNMGAHDA